MTRRFQAKNIVFSRPVLLLILVIIFFLMKADLQVYLENRKAKKITQEKKAELEQLSKEKAELEKEVSQLKNPDYLEKILRERFSVKKPGEELLIITEEKPQGQPAGKRATNTLFDKILKFFKIKK